MYEGIRLVLSIAASHGQQTLVLGAFGCGVFGNDLKAVVTTFYTLLQGEFAQCFARVIFTALSDQDYELMSSLVNYD